MAAFTKQITKSIYFKSLFNQIGYLTVTKSHIIPKHFSKSCVFSNRRYSDKHEWLVYDGKIGKVGVSHYAQDALGDVVYVQAPEIGQEINKDEEAGVVESVKAVNEIYTPVGGKVVEINEKLSDKPSLINESCYDEGWIFKLELSNPNEVDSLMDEESYQKYLKSIH